MRHFTRDLGLGQIQVKSGLGPKVLDHKVGPEQLGRGPGSGPKVPWPKGLGLSFGLKDLGLGYFEVGLESSA